MVYDMKLFNEEIVKFYEMIKTDQKFAISRFGDGEMIAMRGETISSGCGEWNTNGPDQRYSIARDYLKRSLTFKDPGYYVGIVCPCCQGMQNFTAMKVQSGQEDSQLTYANIFVNSNYIFFLQKIVPLFSQKKIVLVANKTSQINRLPFSGEFYPVEYNAWIENLDLIQRLKDRNDSGCVYLFACGPLGKILTQQMWEHNKNNTYLDIGSTLHPWLQSDLNIRGYYQQGNPYSNLVCYWG
jgi:hypothetical protein